MAHARGLTDSAGKRPSTLNPKSETANLESEKQDDHDAWRPVKHLMSKDAVLILETTLEQIMEECEDPYGNKCGNFIRLFPRVDAVNCDFGPSQEDATICVVAFRTTQMVRCPPLGAEAVGPVAPSGQAHVCKVCVYWLIITKVKGTFQTFQNVRVQILCV